MRWLLVNATHRRLTGHPDKTAAVKMQAAGISVVAVHAAIIRVGLLRHPRRTQPIIRIRLPKTLLTLRCVGQGNGPPVALPLIDNLPLTLEPLEKFCGDHKNPLRNPGRG